MSLTAFGKKPHNVGSDMLGLYGSLGAEAGAEGGPDGVLGALEGVKAVEAGSLAALGGHPEGAAGSRREQAAQCGVLGKDAGMLGKLFGQSGGRERKASEVEEGPQVPAVMRSALAEKSDGHDRKAHAGEKLKAVQHIQEKLKELGTEGVQEVPTPVWITLRTKFYPTGTNRES